MSAVVCAKLDVSSHCPHTGGPPVTAITFPSAYELFNYGECAAWIIIAAVLPFWFRRNPAEKRRIIYRASAIFIVFGVSDLLEAPTHGRLPAWLWVWKLLCAAVLLKCRYDYLGKERFRWNERSNWLVLACFLTVLVAMFLQYYYRDILADAG
jgi:hypothetical protein